MHHRPGLQEGVQAPFGRSALDPMHLSYQHRFRFGLSKARLRRHHFAAAAFAFYALSLLSTGNWLWAEGKKDANTEHEIVLTRELLEPVLSSRPPYLVVTPSEIRMTTWEIEDFELKLIGDLGRSANDPEWFVSNPEVLDISDGNPAKLKPRSVGETTVTAVWRGMSANATVRVLPGTKLPLGSLRWLVSPTPGYWTKSFRQAQPTGDDTPDFYSFEQNDSGGTILRAFKMNGTQRWMLRMSDLDAGPSQNNGSQSKSGHHTGIAKVTDFVGDSYGGVLLLLERHDRTHSLVRIDGKAPREAWRYDSSGRLAESWTVHPDGSIFIVETVDPLAQAMVVAIDGKTGKPKFHVPLPQSHYANLDRTCAVRNGASRARASRASAPMTSEDGVVYLEVEFLFDEERTLSDGEKQRTYDNQLLLLKIKSDGSYSFQTLKQYHFAGSRQTGPYPRALPAEVIPDGFGGVQAAWTSVEPIFGGKEIKVEARITRHSSSEQIEYAIPLKGWDEDLCATPSLNMVLGENGIGVARDRRNVVAYDVRSGDVRWTWRPESGTVELLMALAGEKVAVENNNRVIVLSAKGEPSPARWMLPCSEPYGGRCAQLVTLDEDGTRTETGLSVDSVEYTFGDLWLAIQDRNQNGGGGSFVAFSGQEF
jgi:hypothetical protein